MLTLLAFKHVCSLQVVGARPSGGADHSLRVPVDESWLRRLLTGLMCHSQPIAQIVAVKQPQQLRGAAVEIPKATPCAATDRDVAARLPSPGTTSS